MQVSLRTLYVRYKWCDIHPLWGQLVGRLYVRVSISVEKEVFFVTVNYWGQNYKPLNISSLSMLYLVLNR